MLPSWNDFASVTPDNFEYSLNESSCLGGRILPFTLLVILNHAGEVTDGGIGVLCLELVLQHLIDVLRH